MTQSNSHASSLYPWLRPHYSQLTAQFFCRRLHHAMLVHGFDGFGKSQLAQQLAQLLQCVKPIDNKACGQCKSCRLHSSHTHPDYYAIAPLADKATISIDQIRKVQASIINTGLTNSVRVVVITSAELMTTSAVNALLKVLEEPPGDLYFILTCQQRTLLPATIVSRCLAVNVADAPVKKLAAWVSKRTGKIMSVNQFALFNNSPLQAVIGLDNGFLDYASALAELMVNLVTTDDAENLSLYPLLELIKANDKAVGIDKTINLIHLLTVDWVKLASGVAINNGFELTQEQMAKLAKINVAKFLSLERDLNQLKQVFNAQPSINKLLQLQRVIVNFAKSTLQ